MGDAAHNGKRHQYASKILESELGMHNVGRELQVPDIHECSVVTNEEE